MVQRYKFESKSQLAISTHIRWWCCFQWFKGTNLKANHNDLRYCNWQKDAVSNGSKVQIWKQITTVSQITSWYIWLFPMVQRYKFESKSQHNSIAFSTCFSCFQWFKGTNLKANHNYIPLSATVRPAVSNGSKVQIWKQITTNRVTFFLHASCFQWFKGTNLKANHNLTEASPLPVVAVSNGSKVQIWKQITTLAPVLLQDQRLFPMVQRYKFESKSQRLNKRITLCPGCFQWFKGTNLKANHNVTVNVWLRKNAVSNGSKVQIWKQITTGRNAQFDVLALFPMVQRYKFESKSQPWSPCARNPDSCFQWFKGTNLKANHNESGNSKFRAGAVPNSSKIEIQSKSQRQCKEPIENKCCFLCPKDRKIESKSQQPATTSPTSICCVQWL